METIFECSCPCMKYELTKKNIKEFQIQYNVTDEFLESYYENNKKTFLETVYSYIHLHYPNIIKQQGINFHYNKMDVRKPHIYVHIDLNEDTNTVIKKIINDLHNEYETNWKQYRVPKLMTIIKNQINKNDETFQKALKFYQSNHNSNNTETMIHILSNQILWYYDHISFLINRNKYDFTKK